MKKGQGATELLIILGIGLAVLLILLQFTSTSLFGYSSSFREKQTTDALVQLKSAAELLYQQGDGAKTEVYITLPEGINTSNVSGKTLRFSFYDGNTFYRDLSFNVSGNLPISSGGHWIDLEALNGYVYISTNLTSLAYCGNGICDTSENCAADVGTCTDTVCYNPSCTNGCTQVAIVSTIDPGECDTTTVAGSCSSAPCSCSSSSVCIDSPGSVTINLIEPLQNTTNTSSKRIDFSYNVTNVRSMSNCSLLLNNVINMTSTSIPRNTTLNFTVALRNGIYTWAVNCTDSANTLASSTTRNYSQKYIYYLDLWPYDGNYPVAFTRSLNYTANTFWLYGANDGWNWRNWTYMGAPANLKSCVRFTNSTVITVNIGDENCISTDDLGQGSGAYGIAFYVDSEVYETLTTGGFANLSFAWSYESMINELDNNEDVWIKATLGNGSFYAYDDFEARTLGTGYKYKGGWGWQNDWFIEGGGVDTDPDEYTGVYSLILDASNNTVDRPVNLSMTSHPFIEFYAKATGLESDDHAYFRVSNNDSTWYVLQNWTDGDDDDTWRRYRYDLRNYYFNSSQFWVQFRTPDFENGNDEFRVDQILIYDGNYSYLGKSLDSSNQADDWNELYWVQNPTTTNVTGIVTYNATYNMTPSFTSAGWYYLTLGGQVYSWDTGNEGVKVSFDNVTLYVQ